MAATLHFHSEQRTQRRSSHRGALPPQSPLATSVLNPPPQTTHSPAQSSQRLPMPPQHPPPPPPPQHQPHQPHQAHHAHQHQQHQPQQSYVMPDSHISTTFYQPAPSYNVAQNPGPVSAMQNLVHPQSTLPALRVNEPVPEQVALTESYAPLHAHPGAHALSLPHDDLGAAPQPAQPPAQPAPLPQAPLPQTRQEPAPPYFELSAPAHVPTHAQPLPPVFHHGAPPSAPLALRPFAPEQHASAAELSSATDSVQRFVSACPPPRASPSSGKPPKFPPPSEYVAQEPAPAPPPIHAQQPDAASQAYLAHQVYPSDALPAQAQQQALQQAPAPLLAQLGQVHHAPQPQSAYGAPSAQHFNAPTAHAQVAPQPIQQHAYGGAFPHAPLHVAPSVVQTHMSGADAAQHAPVAAATQYMQPVQAVAPVPPLQGLAAVSPVPSLAQSEYLQPVQTVPGLQGVQVMQAVSPVQGIQAVAVPSLALSVSTVPVMNMQAVVQQNAMPPLPGPGVTMPLEVQHPAQYSVPPDMLESFLAVGRTCRNLGRFDLAADAFRACISICPESNDARLAYSSLCWNGVDHSRSDFHALDLGAVFAEDIYNDIGNTLRSIGRTNEAEMAYRAALTIAPRHAHAWNNLGNAMRGRGAIMDAMQCYSASLTCQPGFAAAHCNLAGLLRDQGKPQEAEGQYRAALITDPALAEAAAGLGTALRDMGRTDEAVTYYLRAVNLQPDGADHHANLANTYKDLNRIEESIVNYQSALDINPDLPDAFCNMVHSLCVICDWRNRSQNFEILLGIIDRQLDALLNHPGTHPGLISTLVGALSNSTPQLVDVCGGSRSDRDNASVSTSTAKEENSVDVHKRRFVHHPSSPTVVRKARSRSSKSSAMMTSTAAVVAPVLASGLPSVQPFHALIYPMSPEKFRALAAAYATRAESMVAGIQQVVQRWSIPQGPRARLKVGYVSSDYNNHPYSHLTQSIYGIHTSGGVVECYCYALTPSDNSAWRLRIEREVEHFRDISAMTAKQSAEAIAADGIHVLVNCNGYTKGARTELFALRPAPVQVSFMGFPGTLGAHYIEYFITDVVTSPPNLASRMHSEALLYHPHSYFVNDHRQTSVPGPNAHPAGPLTRAHYGLPEDCFLFIMHNQLYKLSPDTFDVWARILKRVPNSKIWLLRFPPTGEQRIRQEAAARGVSPDRLVFTDVAGKDEHVARAGLGDLFLDTPTCNAHTTGTDVLWSGVPLITCPGSLFASRVAASLLTAAGVPELIAPDMNAYEDLAVELATNRDKLAAIRSKIESSRYTNALFDTERWVRNVEGLYWRAWKNFENGNQPTHIYGQDVYDGSTMVSKGVANEGGGGSGGGGGGGGGGGSGGLDSLYSGSEAVLHGRVYSSTVMT